MTAEDRFAADSINVTLGLHLSSSGRWWGQASYTNDGIRVSVEAHGPTAPACIEALWIEWETKLTRVPNFIPRLVPPVEDATFREVNNDIPF